MQREHDYPIELDGAGLLLDTDLDGVRELAAQSDWEAYVGTPPTGETRCQPILDRTR